jgi:hypothetical protein
MSYITHRHRTLSAFHGEHEVLNNPEKYFGPNYRTLINYWIYCENNKISPLGHYFSIDDPSREYCNFVRGVTLDGALINLVHLTGIEEEIMKCHLFIDSPFPLYYIPQI